MKGTQGFGLTITRAAITGIAASTLLLSACLSGGGEETHWVGDIDNDVTIAGSVGDGPAINADVRILSAEGEELAFFKSDATGSYQVDLKVTGSQFPLLIEATGGTDIVTDAAPDFVLLGAALSSGDRVTANLNPFSTFAVEIARDMNGGVTANNLAAAEDIVVDSINSGLTTLASSGPMQTPVRNDNVAEMIKASETLGEIVRRTRDAMKESGRGTNADAVIKALASDLIDGVIEGNGGPRADSRLAAVANVVAAQVLLESMANELHVNGTDATEDMRSAIGQVAPGADDTALDRLGVTEQMIDQAMNGLSAAFAISADDRVYDLIGRMSSIQPGMEASFVRNLLPTNYRESLNAAVTEAANGDQSVVATINNVVRDGTEPAQDENRAPTISGRPADTVRAGTAYNFRPTASDLDGDVLSFTITGKPDWAMFDENSGRLYGTPQTGDAGTHSGITITVSDGNLQSSVGPFSIEVTVANSAPTISGSPGTSVTAGDPYTFTPRASDPDGDDLTFSISGKPVWAKFDRSNGRLSGTPTAGDIGLHQNIVISVSDGEARRSLSAFSIEVLAAGAATGSVTLSWTPPNQNEDGSQLMDLDGYRVYWGRAGSAYSNTVRINNPSVTRVVVDNLSPGNYEFVATAVNKAGTESRFSNAITKTVN